MNDSRKKKQKRNNHRDTDELLQELDHTEALLMDKERELASCQDALKKAQSQINEFEDIQAELEVKNAELKKIEQQNKELAEETNSFKEENTKSAKNRENDGELVNLKKALKDKEAQLKENRGNLQKSAEEVNRLKEELSNSENNLRTANGHIARLKKDVEEAAGKIPDEREDSGLLKQQLESLRGIVQEKTKEITQLKEALEKRSAARLATSGVTLDPAADLEQMAFNQSAVSRQVGILPNKEAPRKFRRFPRLQELKAILVNENEPTKIVYHDEAFRVLLTLDLADAESLAEGTLSYSAEIYAKPLSGGSPLILGTERSNIKTSGIITLNILPDVITPGIYRLDANVVLRENGTTIPVMPLPEINIMQVN